MKRAALYLCFVVLLASLLIGCDGGGVVPPPPEEPPLDLLREYTGQDNVIRWPNGTVSVVDFTGKTETIWNKINEIVEGNVVFKLTSDPEAKIGIEYAVIEFPFFCGAKIKNFLFLSYGFGIHPEAAEDINIYTQVCLTAAGIEKDKAAEGFSENVKKALYWLYRLEPGYPLL